MIYTHLQFEHGGYAKGQKCAKITAMTAAAEAMSW
jgi:hypothetical protein